MGKFIDLTDKIFGRLKVIKRTEKPTNLKSKGAYWLCECQCGNKIIVSSGCLKSGNTSSCGCFRKDNTSDFNKNTKRKYNTYNLTGEYGIGYDSKGREFYFDLEDYDKIKDYYWIVNNKGYVICDIKKEKNICFHRVVTNCDKDLEVDHKNGNTSRNDNRKNNLRICTHQQNLCNYTTPINNTSGFKGVSFCNTHNVWKSYITYKNKRYSLGNFIKKEDAIKARLDAEIKYFGEYRNV